MAPGTSAPSWHRAAGLRWLTLLALFLGGQGLFGQFVTDVLRPSFGQGAWLLGVLLIVAGVMVERSATVHSGWARDDPRGHPRVPGGGGADPPLPARARPRRRPERRWRQHRPGPAKTLSDLVGPAGAFVVLVGLVVVGLLLMFGLTLRALLQPVSAGGRAIASATVPRSAATVNAGRDASPVGAG